MGGAELLGEGLELGDALPQLRLMVGRGGLEVGELIAELVGLAAAHGEPFLEGEEVRHPVLELSDLGRAALREGVALALDRLEVLARALQLLGKRLEGRELRLQLSLDNAGLRGSRLARALTRGLKRLE